MVSYRTPRSRAQGLGSAHHGVSHWITKRLTSIALIPLCLWVVYAVMVVARTGYEGAVSWVGNPINTTLLVLLLAIGFMHMHAGLRVVFEDYFHTKRNKGALLLLNVIVCVFGAALAIISVLKVAFSGAAVH
jgi:succinate dehydrogenase / fumarate reductase membrane anchor subunit